MTQGAPPSFFSYSRDDSEFVLRLAGDLKAARASVWMDQLDIVPGQRWDRAVEDALANCPCMIVILSPASINSTNVMDEVSFALEERKTVIPVIHKNCTVPFRLRRLQYVDFRQDYACGLRELLKTLAAEPKVGQSTPAISDFRGQGLTDVTEGDEHDRAGEKRKQVAEQERLEQERTMGGSRFRVWMVLVGVALLVVLGITWFIKSRGSDVSRKESSNKIEVQSAAPTTAPTSLGLTTRHEASGGNARAAGRTRMNSRDRLTYVWIEPGTFRMGCSLGDGDCRKDEMPAHSVTITRGFWMGQTAVTQAAYQRVKGSNPSTVKGNQRPVVEVNWYDAVAYCSAVGMRLPTEAEWEYAARAGSSASRYEDLDLVAWWGGNSGNQLHDVAQKQPNVWGLFDMLGNVWQWTADWYSEDYYDQSPSRDPKGPPSGTELVARGGAFHTRGDFVRVSHRGHDGGTPSHVSTVLGFRCDGGTLP